MMPPRRDRAPPLSLSVPKPSMPDNAAACSSMSPQNQHDSLLVARLSRKALFKTK
jgi:hypothetical protein